MKSIQFAKPRVITHVGKMSYSELKFPRSDAKQIFAMAFEQVERMFDNGGPDTRLAIDDLFNGVSEVYDRYHAAQASSEERLNLPQARRRRPAEEQGNVVLNFFAPTFG